MLQFYRYRIEISFQDLTIIFAKIKKEEEKQSYRILYSNQGKKLAILFFKSIEVALSQIILYRTTLTKFYLGVVYI